MYGLSTAPICPKHDLYEEIPILGVGFNYNYNKDNKDRLYKFKSKII